MISESMAKSLNGQLSAEMHSADVYFGLGCDMAKMGLMGFAHWMTQQWREENSHALIIATHLVNRGGEVQLEAGTPAGVEWECPCDAMRQVLKHEQLITSRINALVAQARAEADYATEKFLMDFVEEQTEEEGTVRGIIGKLEMAGEDQAAIMQCDAIMGQRPKYGH